MPVELAVRAVEVVVLVRKGRQRVEIAAGRPGALRLEVRRRRRREHALPEIDVRWRHHEALAERKRGQRRIVAVAVDHAIAVADAADMREVAGHAGGQFRGKLRLELDAGGLHLLVRFAVAEIGAAIYDVGRDPCCAMLTHRHVDRALEVDSVVIAVADRAEARELARLGLGRQHVDRAAGGVAAVERTLRSLEHLDAIEIVEDAGCRGRAADIHPVIVERDGGIAVRGTREVADAAHEIIVVRARRRHRERRDQAGQTVDRTRPGLEQIAAADHVDRHRGALAVLAHALGGDDDVAETGRTCRGRGAADLARRRIAALTDGGLARLRLRNGSGRGSIARPGLVGSGR